MSDDSRVGEVHLRLRIAEEVAPRATRLRELAERKLVPGALAALDEAIRARLGPRAIVRIRRLPLRWRLTDAELEETMLHQRLGIELADALLELAGVHEPSEIPERPADAGMVVVFADAAHALAVDLVTAVERAAVATDTRDAAVATIDELWQQAETLASEQLEIGDLIDRLVRLVATRVLDTMPATLAIRLVTATRPSWPAWCRDAIARRAAVAAPPRGVRETATSPTPAPHAPAPSAAPLSSILVVPAARTESTAPAARDATSPPLEAPPAPANSIRALPTQLAGLAFLIRPILELELAEHLWCAGVDEGLALAHALYRLAPQHDPIFAVIAGRSDDTLPALEVASWAADEVCARTRDGLGRWLAKRGSVHAPDELARALDVLAAPLAAPALHGSLLAALAACACERLDVPWDLAPIRAAVMRAGQLYLADDEIRVELPMASVDVGIRRAGLDADPGWVPWLRRRMRIIYVPGDGDEL